MIKNNIIGNSSERNTRIEINLYAKKKNETFNGLLNRQLADDRGYNECRKQHASESP